MAAAASTPDPSPDILQWLKSLPVAPEYHPTLAEFQDPISYILKIEPEAAKYGICKIIPPLPPPPKKTAIANLNHSFAARHPRGEPAFTTRHQQIGFCPRKPRPVQKPVWQSGESYTLQQFEAKAKQFERAHLRRNSKRALSALEIESLFWKASADKPFSVEYANDMPGSAFAAGGEHKCGETVAETAWNMKGASRAKGSLLRFMKEEIPGVTSPMVYVAMLFSWFAWHVEDHDLHSLNYLHMGAGKTWYGVPRDAAVAFEEVVRVHGYGGEVNPVVTFAILGEKTTVMSPEVLIGAGIPCCRLVQNAGEFVVTFPRAYHSGFSHGFNCGEAANIATPEWLRVAKEAAIRRASINYPPMVSHFQLLYALALSLCSRIPAIISNEPRSSRLKGKKRSEGEIMVKELFVRNVIANNGLLNTLLEKGSSCILLPQDSSDISFSCNTRVGSQIKVKHRLSLGLCSPQDAMEASINLCSEDIRLDGNTVNSDLNGFGSMMGTFVSLCQGTHPYVKYSQCSSNDVCGPSSDMQKMDSEKEGRCQADGLLGQALFACVKCGILSFACVAVVQPREAAARYLMSADCSLFSDQIIDAGVPTDLHSSADRTVDSSKLNTSPGWVEKDDKGVLYDIQIQSADYQVQLTDQRMEPDSDTKEKGVSSLDLLAYAYGDSSDSDEEAIQKEILPRANGNNLTDVSLTANDDLQLQSTCQISSSKCSSLSKVPSGGTEFFECSLQDKMGNSVLEDPHRLVGTSGNLKRPANLETPAGVSNSLEVGQRELDSSSMTCNRTSKVHQCEVRMDNSEINSVDLSVHCGPAFSLSDKTESGKLIEPAHFGHIDTAMRNVHIPFVQRSDKDSSRMHIFCLEHAIEVEKKLRQIGGAHMMLLCHPDYPKVEEQAKALADELGIPNLWKDIPFREPSEDDKKKIQLALDDEEAIPGNGDWAVKMGINLYYSASLCKSPLYSKQMPYNSILYKAFGRSIPNNPPTQLKVFERRLSRQKKIAVAGKWCGKVWMSNQVHPYLADVDAEAPVNELCSQSLDLKAETCPENGVNESCNQDMDQNTKTDTKSNEAKQVNIPEGNSLQHKATAANMKKSGKKRRKSFERLGLKKPKCLSQLAESVAAAEDLNDENPSPPCERTLRSGRTKCQTSPSNYCNEKKIGHGILNLNGETEGGPSTRLRRRPRNFIDREVILDVKAKSEDVIATMTPESQTKKKAKKPMGNAEVLVDDEEAEFPCDIEGCTMGFNTKQDLLLHKRNICPIKGCGKKFFSHKYLVQHRRVHMDDRPLKCPWKGCRMTFKWAWARTEHIRVHTGDRPYVCREPGCGQTFRFVSDFSRHKRKTGHSVKKKGRG